jgi:hypothetical protein
MVNGSKGQLELEVVETDYVAPPELSKPKEDGTIASLYPGHAGDEQGATKLTVYPYWQRPYTVDIREISHDAHGGGDARLTADLFSGTALAIDRWAGGPPNATAHWPCSPVWPVTLRRRRDVLLTSRNSSIPNC